MSAKRLRQFISGNSSDGWVDPDLESLSSNQTVRFHRYRLEAVDTRSGEILVSGRLYAGQGTPADVIGAAVVDTLVGDTDRGWVELHRIPRDAAIRVDGERVKPPSEAAQLLKLSPGEHELALLIEGEVKQTAQVNVRPLMYGVVGLVTPFGTLKVATNPKGAIVKVDGRTWGASPESGTVTAGTHRVTAHKSGCGSSVSRKVDIQAGASRSVKLHLNGWIEAKPTPSNAKVSIDGEFIGRGTQKKEVSYGSHKVSFQLKGFESESKTTSVSVRSCKTRSVSYTFPGKLIARSKPSSARLRVEGQDIGNTRTSTFLKAGKHETRCIWCGYGDVSKEVQLEPGRVTEIKPTLQPVPFQVEIGAGGYGGGLGTGESFRAGFGGHLAGWILGRFGPMFRATGWTGPGGPWSIGGYAQGRLLFPGAAWNMPVGLGAELMSAGKKQIAPTGHLGLRTCLGGDFTIGMHLYSGYNVATKTMWMNTGLDLSWQSAVGW